ncbi:MAG: hypothetical protein K0Q68_1137 [Moraxellaceae bacterium]|jgi:hypothetical protein|nr:hypothetical protein [Moraxellaceae bacterium]
MSDTPDPVTPAPSQLSADPLAIARLLKDEAGQDPRGLPPVHKWNPPYCGEIDMEIRRNGQWFYMGTPIGRAALVRLFSTVLRHDDDGYYYLVTPVEKVRIRVEDAPFLATLVERHEEAGVSYLRFTTQTGDVVVAGPEHPIRVSFRDDLEPSPYVHVRDRLDALISRNVYYQLVEWGVETDVNGRPALAVESAGERYVIGYL